IAENKRSTGESMIENKAPKHTARNLLLMLISLIIVGVGVVGAYYLYSISPLAQSVSTPTAPEKQPVPSIIKADSQVVLQIDNLTPTAILSRLETESAKH